MLVPVVTQAKLQAKRGAKNASRTIRAYIPNNIKLLPGLEEVRNAVKDYYELQGYENESSGSVSWSFREESLNEDRAFYPSMHRVFELESATQGGAVPLKSAGKQCLHINIILEEPTISASMGVIYTQNWLYSVQRTAHSGPLACDRPTVAIRTLKSKKKLIIAAR